MYWRSVFLTGLCVVTVLTAWAGPCGEKIVIFSPGYVTSPGYPSAYPTSVTCEWLIQTPEQDQKILINFNPHFDLEDRECKYDFMEVYDGADDQAHLVGRFCGKIAPSPIVSTAESLHIRFTSDYETTGAGFSIRYEIHRTGTDCSRNFTAPSGVIQTPGFPEKYANNLECTFMILAPNMAEIVLEFDSFEMEPDTSPPSGAVCRFDSLEIWDGLPTVGPHIGRFCGSKRPGRVVSYTGTLSLTIHTDNAITKEGFSANYTIKPPREPAHQQHNGTCMFPLGMESGEIGIDQITASSQYNPSWSPQRSRLNYPKNGWTPSDDSSREWIQVDLGFLRYVSAIGTQGAVSVETKRPYFVRLYRVSVSSNGEDWVTVREGNKHKVFEGNQNPTDEVRSSLPKPVLTRYLRIRPLLWENGICMRFEIYGCKISDTPCSSMLGMVSGQVSDSQISVSPRMERGWLPEQARLLTGRTGWTPALVQASSDQWLQVDLGQERLVTGLVLQGGKLKDKNVFVKKFRVSHSTTGSNWTTVTEGKTRKPKIFTGNLNHDTPEVRSLVPVLTRFVRVHPDRGSPDGMGLRLELLGCDLHEPTTPPPLTSTMATTSPDATVSLETTSGTTVVTTTTEECDDESTSCHSGTGTGEDSIPSVRTISTLEVDTALEFLWFACDFGWMENPSYCGWNPETGGGADWLIQSSSKPIYHKLPKLGHSGTTGTYMYTALSSDSPRRDSGLETETQRERGRAWLVSPPVTAPDSDLCLSFWYHLSGEFTGALHIRQRKEEEETEGGEGMEREKERSKVETLLWTVGGQWSSQWREGRVLMPRADTPYQVVIEGVVDSSGHISVDDIKILSGLDPTECKDPEDEVMQTSAPADILIVPVDYPDGVVNSELGGVDGGVMKTLDPILITIIAMSGLGVLLGAVCGIVLYCACSNTGLTERNLSALENYNFELVDGVKLKKDKLSNTQSSYTEA
ncbi:neuropilin 1b [Chanos chanos]|uniref:Neuropilin-1a-like n=1 Tax=Chanos chanos TaxID=29144 RepID=A0A6J2VEX2_CHACN|nr:neuropilin-1a-like [Chanos chanos]XP_030631411.1 neuropilin-1a-like [Chanos chanos]